MNSEEAKSMIMEGTANGVVVECAVDKSFTQILGKESNDLVLLAALEQLHKDGVLVKVASAGQSRSTVAYRRADKPADVVQIK